MSEKKSVNMNPLKTKIILALALVFLAGTTAFILSALLDERRDHSLGAISNPLVSTKKAAPPKRDSSPVPKEIGSEPKSKSNQNHGAPTVEKVDPLDLDIPLYEKAPPQLRRFTELNKKALRSTSENLERDQILSDATLQQFSLDFVMNTKYSEDFATDVVQKILAIDFIGNSLNSPNNPTRRDLLLNIQNHLSSNLSEFAKNISDKDQRNTWIADQTELMMMAVSADSEGTRSRLEKSSDPLTSAIYEMAKKQLSAI